MRCWRALEDLVTDVRYGFRSMRRSAASTALALFCLALGIGANAALFGVVDALLFRPPAGVEDPQSLARVEIGPAGQGGLRSSMAASYPQYTALRDQAPFLSGLAAYASRDVTLGGGADAEELSALIVTGDYFSILGVKPALGRFFLPDEDGAAGSGPVVVLGHSFWKRHFGGDRRALGQVLTINGTRLTVIGIAPEHFIGVDLGAPDLWVPMSMAPTEAFGGPSQWTPRVFWLRMIGRLQPGVGREQAMTAPPVSLDGMGAPGAPTQRVPVALSPLTTGFGAEQRGQNPVPLWVLGITAAVLLIACATVANLLLARAAVRGREIATRLALGATRGRLVRQLLTESLVLALVAGTLGLLFTSWSARSVQALPVPPIDRLVDARVAAFTLALALLTTALSGLAPALWATRRDLGAAMKEGIGNASPHRSRLQSGLMVAQVAISFVLLISAGLFVRSLRNLRAIDPGFDLEHVITASVDLRARGYSGAEALAFYDRALERVQELPGVEAATIGRTVPFYLFTQFGIEIPDGRSEELQPTSTLADFVGRDYFRAMGIDLAAGRVFTEEDHAGAPPVAVISEAMAREYWPTARAIGECFRITSSGADAPCVTIVGVVRDAKYEELRREARPIFYRPITQEPNPITQVPNRPGQMTVFVRTRGEPGLAAAVRREIQSIDPELPFVRTEPLVERVRPQLIPWQVAATLFGVFGALASFLAAIGLYTVVAFMTVQRTREIGIRAALGARNQDITALVLARGGRLAAIGIAIGLAGSLAVTRIFAGRMYGIHTADPLTYAFVAALLGMVSLLASYVPARRAARVSPMDALRYE